MSKVTFRSKQPYFQLSYMDVFKVGCITVPVVGGKPYKDAGKPNIGLSTLFQTNFFRLFFRYCTGV